MAPLAYDTPIDYETSRKYYKDSLEAKSNEWFDYASDVYKIQEEPVTGTLQFQDIVCRVTHAINAQIGKNLGDDFRNLIFKDFDTPRIIGQRYYFDDSVWLTINTDNYKSVTKSAIIRRCNNVLKFVRSDGSIFQEPCVVDYAIKYANIYFNTTVNIQQGSLSLITQYNEHTKNITINDRFILGSQVYKIKARLDAFRKKTYEEGSQYLTYFEVIVDEKQTDDNFEYGIANTNKYPYINYNKNKDEIRMEPNRMFILEGKTTTFDCFVYIDGVKQDLPVLFTFSNVPKEAYEIVSITDNSFTIKNLHAYYNSKLIVKCVSGDIEQEFEMELRGVF